MGRYQDIDVIELEQADLIDDSANMPYVAGRLWSLFIESLCRQCNSPGLGSRDLYSRHYA
jgi:hypothetical protein